MTELDPYALLGVPRTALRAEIARAYRRLAKQHHPDAGAPASQAFMVRLNEAWFILSDPARRARWDRAHAVVAPPHWAAAPAEPMRRRPATAPYAPPSPMDSGWVAVAVVGAVAVMVAVIMLGVSMAAQPADDRLRFTSDELRFAYPNDWQLATGEEARDARHRVVAHLVTFAVDPSQLCTGFGAPCPLSEGSIPPGEASIVITAWEGGSPPVPDPVIARPYGLDADAIIGGRPAVLEVEQVPGGAIAWWQLSPPGFPDRWIEVRADLGGGGFERAEMLDQIIAVLDTAEFGR